MDWKASRARPHWRTVSGAHRGWRAVLCAGRRWKAVPGTGRRWRAVPARGWKAAAASRWPRAGGAVVVAGVAAGAVVALRALVDDAGGALLGPGVAAAVVGLNLAGNALLVSAWRRLLAAAGAPLGVMAAARIWVPAQLARYTIGAAQVPGRVAVGARRGVAAGAGMATTLAEIVWLSCVVAAVVLATAPWWLADGGPWRWLAGAAVVPVAVLAAGLVAPAVVLSLAGRAIGFVTGHLRLPTPRHRRAPSGVFTADSAVPPVPPVAKDQGSPPTARSHLRDGSSAGAGAAGVEAGMDRRAAAAVTGRYLAVVGLRVAATLVVFAALGGDVAGEAVRVAGAWGVGQLAGQLAVVAPGGLGAREGAAALVLAPALGGELALLLVALVRLGEICAELVGLALLHMVRAN